MEGLPKIEGLPQIIIAFITFVLGPVLVVLVTNASSARKAKAKAEEVVAAEQEPQPGEGRNDLILMETFLEWRDSMRRETAKLKDEIIELRDGLLKLQSRVAELEKENALLRLLNQHNARKVIELGGQPFVLASNGISNGSADQ